MWRTSGTQTMDARLHRELLQNTESLRSLLAEYSTEGIVGMCAVKLLTLDKSDGESVPLQAPHRQVFFLLGLMLTTREPARRRDFGDDEWRRSVELLNAVMAPYALMFWPTPEESSDLGDGWYQAREVAMPAFLHYIGAGLPASTEQVAERIRRYITPLDHAFQMHFGFTASKALEVTDWIAQRLQSSADELSEATAEERRIRLALLDRAKRDGWGGDRIRKEVRDDRHLRDFYTAFIERIGSFLKIRLTDIEGRFGKQIAQCFWREFTCRRGEVHDFKYLTESNTAEERPLFEVEKNVALCVSAHALYEAILKVGEERLSGGEKRKLFLRKRGEVLEAEAEEKLRVLFGDDAEFFPRVSETATGEFEHDLIIRWRARLFVIEAKASPPEEPFRDPDRAFTRLKQAFRSDTGIQKAYEQANRVRISLASGNALDLYDIRGKQKEHIEPGDLDRVYCVCVTRDDFGALAADLSLLLSKDETDPYPWAVNILDLANLADTWEYFGWGPDKLCEYLDDRVRLNGRVLVFDELDLVGYFIQHGGLSTLVQATCDRAFIDPTYSSVIDRIYLAKHGGDPVQYAPTRPIMRDLREATADLDTDSDGRRPAPRARRKQGRNEPCACGSGRKYKKCCGRRA